MLFDNLTITMDSLVLYPEYHRLVTVVVPDLWHYYQHEPSHPDGFVGDVRTYCVPISWEELKLPFSLAIIWTLMRVLMTTKVFKVCFFTKNVCLVSTLRYIAVNT